jgi:hypothetical protein
MRSLNLPNLFTSDEIPQSTQLCPCVSFELDRKYPVGLI